MTTTINVADRVCRTRAEGPGWRYAIWVQGCPMRCAGCCNPEMLEFRDAHIVPVDELLADILATEDIEGITVVGGEPFSQAKPLAELAERLHRNGLSVMVFSGFYLDFLRAEGRPDWNQLLEHTDLLVDGPFVESQLVTDRRWIGSSNQRTHFLTDRYRHLKDEWGQGKNTVEIRLVDGQVQVNGFPHPEIGRDKR